MDTLQPKLRFPEFTSNWELNTFNHFFKIGSSKRVLQQDWQTVGIPFYRTRELVKLANNEIINNEIFIKEELFELLKNKYGVPQIGDLLISGVGTLGISYIVNNSKPFYFKDGNVIWFKKIKNINSQYFNYIFQNSFVQNQIFDNASITTVGTFTIDNANKTKFYFSNEIEEQTKIANFLSSVDEKLNLLKEKKSLLEDYKKGIMQKIFNQEIRFKDDNGNDFEDWSEHYLGDLIDIASSKRVLQEEWTNEGIPFLRTREIISLANNEEFRTPIYISNNLFEKLKSKYGVPKKDDLLVTGVGTIGEAYIVKNEDKFYFKDGNVIWFKMNEKINSKFLWQLFKSPFVKKQLSDNASITTVATFTIEGARKTLILYPSLKEQTKIANFLSAIDEKIELVSNQIENTKEYKNGLLQQMFV